MAEIRLSTAGIKFYYAVEDTAGTRPTTMSSYTEIPEVTEMPEVSSTPETYDATPLSQTKNRVYVDGLIDPGGALSFSANFSQTELTLWNTTIVGAYNTAAASGKAMWFCAVIPGFDDAFYMQGKPSKLGLPNITVGSVLTTTLPITPTGDMDWYAKPTE